jgi:hypothetical protein
VNCNPSLGIDSVFTTTSHARGRGGCVTIDDLDGPPPPAAAARAPAPVAPPQLAANLDIATGHAPRWRPCVPHRLPRCLPRATGA